MNFKVLKRELGGMAVFAVASGSMISSGLFVLPGLAYETAGPAAVLSYFIAAIMVIPAMFAKAELATAMPRSGGTYFFVHRSLGPLLGTFAGVANWLSLSFKTAFALLGIGIFATMVWPGLSNTQIKLIAIGFTLFFTLLNLIGTKESGSFQIILVFVLLALIGYYVIGGFTAIQVERFIPFSPNGTQSILATAGMVFISFGGLTKVASIAQEIKDPGKNITRGMFSAWATVSFLYVLTVFVTIGILEASTLSGSSTPISQGAVIFGGDISGVLLSIAALAAFITTGNAGIMAASRSPLAMAADGLLPPFFAKISPKRGTPITAILFTALFIILSIWFLDLKNLVKTASAMMLILFSFDIICLMVMRSSKISTYKPQFRTPLYPILPIIGLVFYIFLIVDMGFTPITMTTGFFVISLIWYFAYSKSRSNSQSALILLVERMISQSMGGQSLRAELQEILIERDNIVLDRFDGIIEKAKIIELDTASSMDDVFSSLGEKFSKQFDLDVKSCTNLFHQREKESTTVIHQGLAVPHIVVPGKEEFDIIVMRSKDGVKFEGNENPVHLIFALAGSQDERTFHLQSLMAIAQIVKNNNFLKHWDELETIEDLRSLIILAERVRECCL